MKGIFRTAAIASLIIMMAGCNSDTLSIDDMKKDEYVHNFIQAFGVPAEGHDFAMAVSAGLKVKTATGGHVTVTAEIDGKEYLFADVNVPAGIHALPVTIPNSVTTLKIRTGLTTFEAGVNDIVDIDADTPQSRDLFVKVDVAETSSGQIIDPYLNYNNDKGAGPVLIFKPEDFLNKYLSTHPEGKDGTYKWYVGKNEGKGYINIDVADSIFYYYGEIGLGTTVKKKNETTGAVDYSGTEYMIFPVWWRTNRYGVKDYSLSVDQFDRAKNREYLHFYHSDNDEATIPDNVPFPRLGYSKNVISPGNVMDKLSSFIYDTGSLSRAFDPGEAGTVVTEGLKVCCQPDEKDLAAIRFDLFSGNTTDGTFSYSSTVPYWNNKGWGDKYYDVTLSDLMFANVGAMMYPLPEQDFLIHYPGDANGKISTFHSKHSFLIGFSSQPNDIADTYKRDYTDVILLVLPVKDLVLFYNTEELDRYVWTMAVEDLGSTDDWDFNDVVFHFTDVIESLNTVNGNSVITNFSGPSYACSGRTITVWPVATGGTLPIYITFSGTVASVDMPEWGDRMFSEVDDEIYNALLGLDDLDNTISRTYVLGAEVHEWLGASNYTQFVNVGANRTDVAGKKVKFFIPKETVLSYTKGTNYGSEENKPLYGFSLLVDKDNALNINALNSTYNGVKQLSAEDLAKVSYSIGAPSEKGGIAPQMLLIADGDGSWQWPTERTKISDAYEYFGDWVANKSNANWHKYPTGGNVTSK